MSKPGMMTIADFEWGAVGQYIIWLQNFAGLTEIRGDDINSFSMARFGPERLAERKRKTAAALAGNMAVLERFVASNEDDLDDREMAVIRGLYRDLKRARETCLSHAFRADDYAKMQARTLGAYMDEEGDSDELPF